MMERIREGTNSLAVKIILSLIIFSFAFAGVGSYLAGGSNPPAATVGDKEISRAELDRAYQNERARMQQQAGEQFNQLLGNPEYVKRFRQNILDRMINDLLLEQAASELGLRVSDAQVKAAIRAMPQFRQGGQFNNDRYQAALRQTGMSADEFANYMRTDLMRQQLVNGLQGSGFVLPSELENLYRLEAQSRQVRTITLPVADFAEQVSLTDDELEAYYQANRDDYIQPRMVKVAYVELTGEGLANEVQVSDEAIATYYQENQSQYGSQERRKVSHILIEGTGDEAKAKAQQALERLNQGAAFAALAKEMSDDTFSAEQGGSLDWIEPDVMDPAFENAAYALSEKGDVSGLVQSDFGYHIIRLDDIDPADVTPLAEVKDDIRAELQQARAADRFYAQSTTLAEVAFEEANGLEPAADAVNSKVQYTDYFALDAATGLMARPQIQQALDSYDVRENGLNSELIELSGEHAIVVRLDDVKPEKQLSFAEVKDQVRETLAAEKGQEQAKETAGDLIAQLEESGEVTGSDYTFSAPITLNRVSQQQAVAELAFSLPQPASDNASYGVTQNRQGDVVVVALDKVMVPEVPDISPQSQMAARVQRAMSNMSLSATLQALREEVDVTYAESDTQ
ncbi:MULTISPECIES: peptidylprolyl isomerase [unclassified Salinivibrio]|uniref:peptidylprolyl isomerase n=1 Tax=unclassified Salinivibrio TaxID=2636825 RepID=UPI00128B01DB|nr:MULTISPECIES: peptidylprolyl isomerase [unclassified Salinivibrio]MPS32541.1 peptidylprolyl isomerase [Salinivibrio sp. VYel7]MPX90538.1 peptidylprolyl isomerase [Salinivibrio sp. VYel1]MPX93932.1 peptidylprolyl isomerase [Salinivibrio sp. VYel9]MPX96169.1 peptidylprolyl isomerase [Salinivibrio sp. VYel6]MPY00397.1 peptidylprolyl isomerase [Salinivibrio sp. VYel4]